MPLSLKSEPVRATAGTEEERPMKTEKMTTLIRLRDSDHILADPTEDIRGLQVQDRDGQEIGKVEDLLVDSEEHKVRFLRVDHGGLLGIGTTPSFIPVD